MNIGIREMKKNKMLYIIVCVITFFMIYIMNYMTGYTSDDYMYHFFFNGKLPNASTTALSIKDLPSSIWNHYCGYNGRAVAHIFVQFFMIHNKLWFNICNSIVFLLTGILLLAHIRPNPKNWSPKALAFIYTSMFFFFPHFGLSVLWLAGACNYLWMCFLLLLFLLPYKKYQGEYSTKNKLLKIILMSFLGLLSGCSNENSGGAIILLSTLLIGYWVWKHWKIPAWSIAGVLSACVGFLILLLAPGGKARMSEGLLSSGVLLKRLREFCGFSFRYLFLLCIILFVIVFQYIRLYKKTNKNWISDLIVPFLYCFSGAASVIVLLASPVISGKSWIWAVSFMMIAIGTLSDNIYQTKKPSIKKKKIWISFFVILTLVRYGVAIEDIHHTWVEQQTQISQIEAQKKENIMDVSVPLLTNTDNLYNATSRTVNISKQKDAWFNQWMAAYYGVNSITGVETKQKGGQ